ncbi:MAG: hypothetical protein AAF532_02060 [Planctomycetota bacterium]
MTEARYFQCRLRQAIPDGYAEQTSWLPERFTKVGSILSLRGDDRVWDGGWEVVSVGGDGREESLLPDYRKAVRRHRAATGDALAS